MKWEYNTRGLELDGLWDNLNSEGARGWELVSFQPFPEHMDQPNVFLFVFKRPVNAETGGSA